MISQARKGYHLYKYLGSDWLLFRLKYALQLKTGQIRRALPASEWSTHPLSHYLREMELADPEQYAAYRIDKEPKFFFASSQKDEFKKLLEKWDTTICSPVLDAENLQRGTLKYFSSVIVNVGCPPDWFHNHFTDQTAQNNLHWSKISDFDLGDIKAIWEPSRFSFVYSLVRAYWRTGDEGIAELFWTIVEDWIAHNPPQTGPNWKCGQETTFRVMACCFGLYGFAQAKASTPKRIVAIAQLIAISGQRIEQNLDYALSQRNNHGVSEGVGLWTIGLLFPELKQAAQWKEQGRTVLETLGRELIYDDGAFSQHSFNYHRLMLHDYLWAIRLGELHDQPFSHELLERVERSGQFLYQLQDEHTGHLPCYGSNDGALILPLSNCDYHDFRPIINSIGYLCNGQRSYCDGPWDEDMLWLFGPDSLSTAEPNNNLPVRQTNFEAKQNGYYVFRSQLGHLFTRCGAYQDRPGHADTLHVDIWWKGQNMVCDAGTYSYNAPEPWNYELRRTRYHNTVTVDGLDQMDSKGRFLWLPWLSGAKRALEYDAQSELMYWEGQHDGYERLSAPAIHRRAIVRLPNEHWAIIDLLSSAQPHTYRLHWLLSDLPYRFEEESNQLMLMTPVGDYHVAFKSSSITQQPSLIRAQDDSAIGWQAKHYSSREPALSVSLCTHTDTTWFCTVFGPDACQIATTADAFSIQSAKWQAKLYRNNHSFENNSPTLIHSVELFHAGKQTAKLSVN